ncbi:hypothetical protein MMC11_009124 [Xylographa trunciseda]|nr:hypothetical protein [Xylographa trunciseda]
MSKVSVQTVDTMQGEENSVIILSMVSTENLGFMQEPQRMCVALNRARDALIMFHNASSLTMNLNHRELRVYKQVVDYLLQHGALKAYDAPTGRIFMEDDEDVIFQREKDLSSGHSLENEVPAQDEPEDDVTKGKRKAKEPSAPSLKQVKMAPNWGGEGRTLRTRPSRMPKPSPPLEDPRAYDMTPEIDNHGQVVAGPSTSTGVVMDHLRGEEQAEEIPKRIEELKELQEQHYRGDQQ